MAEPVGERCGGVAKLEEMGREVSIPTATHSVQLERMNSL
jgi:hypothetical protein